MKQFFFSFLFVIVATITSWAQAPNLVSYQAIARNNSGAVLANTNISIRVSIKNTSSSGPTVYQETFTGITTNQFGLFTLQIGNGNPVTGTFTGINWGVGDKYIKLEFDPAGGTSYADMGTTQLLSVPYALYAAQSGGGSSSQTLNDLTDVNTAGVTNGQVLSWNGTSWVPVTVSAGTDAQTLSISGTSLTISNGNTVTLPAGGIADNWGTQTVVTDATLSGNGTTASNLKIAQQGASNGQVLKWNGNTWAPSADNNSGSSYTAGTGISITGNTISNTGDNDTSTTNEIQTLSLSGSTLTLSNGGGNVTLPSGGSSLWTASGNNIYNSNTANVGVGNTTPIYKFDVNSTTGTSIYGKYSGTTAGTKALWGSNQNTTSLGQNNIGVYGDYNSAAYGAGVAGIGFNGITTMPASVDIGVYGSAANVGVYGSTPDATAVYGSSGYISVYGYNQNANPVTVTNVYDNSSPAGYFFTDGGKGLFSLAQGSDLLSGSADPNITYGATILGNNDAADYNVGIMSYALNSSAPMNALTGMEIYTEGQTGLAAADYSQGIVVSPLTDGFLATYAGYFVGDVDVVGNLAKGGGTFKIDHPLDPSNKYLYHSFIESPDMMNIYNGNITTDANGTAVVTLPEYFEALNKDFKYQLTVMGTFAQAIVGKEISNNQFTIKTSVPNVKVSWQVTGVRQDAWANANRVVTEVEKVGKEKGKYLYPELYGQKKEDGIAALHFSNGLKPQGAKKLTLADLTAKKVVKK